LACAPPTLPRRGRPAELAEVGNRHRLVWKPGRDLECAAECLDVAAQVADVDVGALFQLGDGRLLDLEDARKRDLRALARLAQLGRRHLLFQLADACGHACALLAREADGQVFKGAVSGHRMSPSRLSSAMYWS